MWCTPTPVSRKSCLTDRCRTCRARLTITAARAPPRTIGPDRECTLQCSRSTVFSVWAALLRSLGRRATRDFEPASSGHSPLVRRCWATADPARSTCRNGSEPRRRTAGSRAQLRICETNRTCINGVTPILFRAPKGSLCKSYSHLIPSGSRSK